MAVGNDGRKPDIRGKSMIVSICIKNSRQKLLKKLITTRFVGISTGFPRQYVDIIDYLMDVLNNENFRPRSKPSGNEKARYGETIPVRASG
jgi:hypothetical protein